MGSPMASSDLTFSDLERLKSRSPKFQVRVKVTQISGQSHGHPHFKNLISCKGAKLGHMLLLTINRKPSMASPMTP